MAQASLFEDSNAEACAMMPEVGAGLEDAQIQARLRSTGLRIDKFAFDEALEHLNTLREKMEEC